MLLSSESSDHSRLYWPRVVALGRSLLIRSSFHWNNLKSALHVIDEIVYVKMLFIRCILLRGVGVGGGGGRDRHEVYL